MRFLVLFILLAGCSNRSLEGKCFKPYVYAGRFVKVVGCTNNFQFNNYCLIYTDGDKRREDTVFVSSLDNSLEVKCPAE